jgi:hypothetical protein
MKKSLVSAALLVAVSLHTLAFAEDGDSGPTITGDVDTSELKSIPDRAPDDSNYNGDPYGNGPSSTIMGRIGENRYNANNKSQLQHLRDQKDCGKQEALNQAAITKKRLDIFRALVERDKKNVTDVKKAMSAHTYPENFFGIKSQENAIPLMNSVLNDLGESSGKKRFKALKDACTKAGDWGLHELDYWIPQMDKAIFEGTTGGTSYAAMRFLEAAGKVTPPRSLKLQDGKMGFLRSVSFSEISPKNSGCRFPVPFEGQAVAKVLQEKTHDGKQLEILCDTKFKDVQVVNSPDKVQIQIGIKNAWLGNREIYPSTTKIMDKVLEATDGPNSRGYTWDDYGGMEGLRAEFFH